ncbi:DUF1275 family protein [Streptomyces torulosus]|uniref:DUF1275 family protein n=1 Tax=Streptomyces torulosus TaxID=68276 RepID=UPI0006EB37A5|nr:DUF1275 family protein [Streptomyces torulosus]
MRLRAGVGLTSVMVALTLTTGMIEVVSIGSRFESSVDAHGRRWFASELTVEALLLGLGGLVAWRTGVDMTGAPADTPHFAVVAGAMGVRNVTTLRARVADVPPTVSTRALTALLSDLPPHPDTRMGARPGDDGRRLASVAVMFTGGLLGAWLLHEEVHPAVVLLLPAALVLALGVVYRAMPRQHVSESG